jgi:acetolactate synthase-1/2/3 large subunit
MRVSDYILQYLKDNYAVDTIFTVSGGGCIFLIDSLNNVEGLKYIATHHEQAAAIAAEGYARMKEGLGACIVTSGPGATNAITGVMGAWVDSIPMIVLSGQVNKEMTTQYTGLNLRQLGDQELNIIECVKSITKYAVQVNEPSQIKYHLEKACKLATTGRPGPVWIDLPLNVQSANIDPTKLSGYNERKIDYKVSESDIDQIINRLKSAKKPLMIVGNGIRLAKGVEDLRTFIKSTNIPVISAVNGNDLVNDDYENYVGRFGTHAQICANQLLSECDFLLSVGSRLYVRQTGYNFEGFAENAFRVYVDIDKDELDKPTLFPNMKVVSDAKVFLSALNNRDLPITNKHWTEYTSEKYRTIPRVLDRHRNNKNYVSHYHFIEKLQNYLTEDDHIVTSDGSANVVTMQVMKLKGKQRLITNTGCAPMGYGMPAAIGAAATGNSIVCIEGDGSLHLNIHELQTIKHNNLPIRMVLFNNQGYTSIKISQKSFFNGKFTASESNSGVSFPNFEKLIKAYDIPYIKLSNHESIDDVLSVFCKSEGPIILEVLSDPEEYHEPKVVAKLNDEGKFVPGNLHDIKWID